MTKEDLELLSNEVLAEELASRFDNFFLVAAHPRRDVAEKVECAYLGYWKADGSGVLLEDFIADAMRRAGLIEESEDWDL